MKKILAILMSIFLVGSLAACGPKQTEGNKEQDTTSESRMSVRIGSLKGPTSMGLVSMMEQTNEDRSADYDFTMVTAADELLTKIVGNELDIALIPANMASVLYNKTGGKISVIDINTLGVLYIVTGDAGVTSLADLKGKTIYLTGKGTTPDYVIQYLLKESNLSEDVTLEYKSEATEVAAVLKEDSDKIGLLPQPFATVACANNDKLSIKIDLTKAWDEVQGEGGSSLVTGVTIVRDEFLEKNEKLVQEFMEAHKESSEFAAKDLDKAAKLVVKAGIIEKEPIAKKAIPYCSITYIDGAAMNTALKGYLEVLHGQNPQSVGGDLPGDDFYYLP